MLDEIKKKAFELQEKQRTDPNAAEKDKVFLKQIIGFLKIDRCFLHVPMQAAFNILIFVGYPIDEVREVYSKVLFEQSQKKNYIYVNPEKLS